MHALERQDLSCTYLAHHELESIDFPTIIVVIMHADWQRSDLQRIISLVIRRNS